MTTLLLGADHLLCILTFLFGSRQSDQRGRKKKKKRHLNKLNHEWKVTLKTIWPQSQQDFEGELGANEDDGVTRPSAPWSMIAVQQFEGTRRCYPGMCSCISNGLTLNHQQNASQSIPSPFGRTALHNFIYSSIRVYKSLLGPLWILISHGCLGVSLSGLRPLSQADMHHHAHLHFFTNTHITSPVTCHTEVCRKDDEEGGANLSDATFRFSSVFPLTPSSHSCLTPSCLYISLAI